MAYNSLICLLTPLLKNWHGSSWIQFYISAKFFFDYLSHFEVIKPFITKKGLFLSFLVAFPWKHLQNAAKSEKKQKRAHSTAQKYVKEFPKMSISAGLHRTLVVPVSYLWYRRYFVIEPCLSTSIYEKELVD